MTELEGALAASASDLLAYFERRVDERADAADLLGEVMLQAWTRSDALPESPERRRMWLFTIARNVHANHRRSVGRRTRLVESVREILRAAAPIPDVGEEAAVRDAVRRLPPRQREIVMLVHWDGFALVEAAELLDVSPSTARSHYAAARAALHAALTAPAPDPVGGSL